MITVLTCFCVLLLVTNATMAVLWLRAPRDCRQAWKDARKLEAALQDIIKASLSTSLRQAEEN